MIIGETSRIGRPRTDDAVKRVRSPRNSHDGERGLGTMRTMLLVMLLLVVGCGSGGDVRFGLTEQQRYTAFDELQDAFVANAQVTLEREELDSLDEQSSRRIEAKYGLTSTQLDKILIEALEKDWFLKRSARRGS